MGGSRPAGLSGHGPACQAKLNVRPGRPTWQAGLAFGNPACIDGVFGKAAIQSHSLPIDDLNIAECLLGRKSFRASLKLARSSAFGHVHIVLTFQPRAKNRPLWSACFNMRTASSRVYTYIWPRQCSPRYNAYRRI